jgi:thiol-disulfide isomerase/thioredoxin
MTEPETTPEPTAPDAETAPGGSAVSAVPVAASEPAPPAPAPTAAKPAIDPRWGVLVVALLVVATVFWPRAGTGAAEPPPAQGGFVLDATGRPIPLGRELKPVTLVHFWSTWCPPCLDELPKLVRFAEGVGDDRFGLVLVAVADETRAAQRFLGSERFPLFFDPDWEVAHRFRTEKLPETHLVVQGEVVESFIGASDWLNREVQNRVLRHLSGRV